MVKQTIGFNWGPAGAPKSTNLPLPYAVHLYVQWHSTSPAGQVTGKHGVALALALALA